MGFCVHLVVAFLVLAINDRLLAAQYTNVLYLAKPACTADLHHHLLSGVNNLWKAASATFPDWIGESLFAINLGLSLGITFCDRGKVYSQQR